MRMQVNAEIARFLAQSNHGGKRIHRKNKGIDMKVLHIQVTRETYEAIRGWAYASRMCMGEVVEHLGQRELRRQERKREKQEHV